MQQPTPEVSPEQTMISPLVSLSASEASSQVTGTASPENNATVPVEPPNHTFFYTQDDDLDLSEVDDQDGQSSPYVLPFQPSAALPSMVQSRVGNARAAQGAPPPPASSPGATQRRSFSLLKILLIVGVVVLTIIVGGVLVFAQSAAPPVPTQGNGLQTRTTAQPPTKHPASLSKTRTSAQASATPSPTPFSSNQGMQATGMQPVTAFPSQHLLSQLGWTNAGLSMADALEAERTATTFVDREMSFDYRHIGSPTEHSGTLNAATFLLTPGGQVRFVTNDVRMINDVLYNNVHNAQLIQQVVETQPTLVTFQVQQIQGQTHQFAWVAVSFVLFQSQIDPTTGQRVEGLELDPATGQPRLHHMSVVLLRVAPANQGPNAPMGGTGWLVNVYALDAVTLPAIATAPAL